MLMQLCKGIVALKLFFCQENIISDLSYLSSVCSFL